MSSRIRWRSSSRSAEHACLPRGGFPNWGRPLHARQPRPGIPGGPGRARSRRGIPRVPRPAPAGPRELLAQLRARPRVTARRAGDRAALGADRADLKRLLADVDVVSIAEDALQRALERFEADCPVDLYLMVGVGAANAGELVVGGRGIAFVCLEHFTGRANPQTYGMGLAPHLLPLWVAHETAHAVRYTSPTSRADLRRRVAARRRHYDYWDTGSRATLRELLVNEGAAVAAAQAVAPGLEPWEYFG